MTPGFRKALAAAAVAASALNANAADAPEVTPERAKRGGALYAQHCAPCHGPRMQGGDAFDLRKFPLDEHERFVRSVTRGKSAMPPWGDLLKPDDVLDLWSYVSIGEKN